MDLKELIRKDLNIITEAKAKYKWYIIPDKRLAYNKGINNRPSIILFQDEKDLKYYIIEVAIGKLSKKLKYDIFGQMVGNPTDEEKQLYINLSNYRLYTDISFFKNAPSEYFKIKEFLDPQEYYEYIVVKLGIEGQVLETAMQIKPTFDNAYKIGIYTIQIPNTMKEDKVKEYLELFKMLDNCDNFNNLLNKFNINNINVIFTILSKFWGDYQPHDKTIRLNIKNNIAVNKFVSIIAHEIGHDIYHTYLSPENTRQVEEMYKKAKSENLASIGTVFVGMPVCNDYRISEYAMENDDEYFAELTSCYAINKLAGQPLKDYEKIVGL